MTNGSFFVDRHNELIYIERRRDVAKFRFALN